MKVWLANKGVIGEWMCDWRMNVWLVNEYVIGEWMCDWWMNVQVCVGCGSRRRRRLERHVALSTLRDDHRDVPPHTALTVDSPRTSVYSNQSKKQLIDQSIDLGSFFSSSPSSIITIISRLFRFRSSVPFNSFPLLLSFLRGNDSGPLFRRSTVPKFLYSEGPLFRSSTIPKVRYSQYPLFRRSTIPKVRYSEGPLFRRLAIRVRVRV